MPLHQSNRVPATAASALVFGESENDVMAFDVPEAGERIVHLPLLRAHHAAGFSYVLTGPNCLMRWSRIAAGYTGPVDVVVHFHGYKGHNQMRLASKAVESGMNLAHPGVNRPTLALVPHGHAFASRTMPGVDGFDFPAISTKDELDTFIDEALTAWTRETGGGRITRGRVILTAHSGGGSPMTRLMQSIGAQAGVHGFQYFDATYGGQAALTARHNWIETAIARDAAALAAISGEEARRRYLQSQGSHLRICFIDGTGTAAVARATDAFVRERLQALNDPAVRELLRKYFRAQKVARPQQVGHGTVPGTFCGRLLADAGHDLAPDAQDLLPPHARAHGLADGNEAWSDTVDEAAAWDTEAQDVVMPVLVTRERAADAPTGSAFIASLGERKGVEREERIVEQLRAGNIQPSLLTFLTVRTSGTDRKGQRHEFEYYVTPDVLSIGSESDSVRIPMDPVSAQQVADMFNCLLPTARMVDQIYRAAPTKLTFIYGDYAGTARAHLQDASSSYLDHSRAIDAQLRRPPTVLTAGHKKELVISNNYVHKGQHDTHPVPKLAFYGAYKANGEPHQRGQGPRGMPSFAHEPSFVDYSHGVRLVWPTMKLDGEERLVADILRDKDLAYLLAAEGPIQEPRYTFDRRGRKVSARAQAASYDDPLALDWSGDAEPVGSALGYGTSWDERIRTTLDGFLAYFMGIPTQIGSHSVRVHPPYFMNAHAKSLPATKERHRIASDHRAAAPAPLRTLINERRFAQARIGKSTPEMLRDLLQTADQQGLLQQDPRVNGNPTASNLRAFLQHYGLGIDCSGFVAQAINKLIALFPSAVAGDRIAEPHSRNAASLKGGQRDFELVTDPTQLCAGDTMWKDGHIRIVTWAERRGNRIVFCTAESRSSNPQDIGPAVDYWRLTPDAQAHNDFRGWRLERSNDLNAADSSWARVPQERKYQHVYGHYRPLRRLLQAAGVTPVALDTHGVAAPAAGAQPVPRVAITRDLTQAEIDRLAAIRFRNVADIEAFFRRSGQAGFIDWYNAGLAHSAPFGARGATATTRIARDRYTAFWNQVRTAFDRDEINALDFAAFTAISINETRGHLWANPERGGAGRADAKGEHRGLAYFFDRVQLGPNSRKASYNQLSGGRSAGWCFDNADFIDAHGGLPGGAQLAHHGNDLNGAWHGYRYPAPTFSTDENPAVNGFIMQADFHKFRGRGVIQTTGRASYGPVVRWIRGYGGTNPVLLHYKQLWAPYTVDVACTRSRTEDWDRIFGESEMLAKGLSLHAGAHGDYRQMSTDPAVLLHVPAEKEGSAGQSGSIYAMGRRISGSRSYGSGIYRQRVLALMHGMLAI